MHRLIIIGAGAAGIMAAISARKQHPDYNITILEKNPVLGKKILICGAGRCNVTNARVSIDRYYGAPSKFISTVVNQFNNHQVINFLSELGIELYEEEKNGRKKGKIFPVTNQAKTITELLESELQRLRISIEYNLEVKDLQQNDKKFILTVSKSAQESKLEADFVILACGGKTYPNLGATGFGYTIAAKLGHKIIEPVPSALPIEAEHPLISRLAGIRIDAEITSLLADKPIKTDTDEMLFTKYGLSGPVILNISREISVRLNRDKINDCKLKINLFPGETFDSLISKLQSRWLKRPDQKVLFSIYGLIPNQIAQTILEYVGINKGKLNKDLNREEKNKLTEILTNWIVDVKATKSWNEGEFTAGGVDTKEVNASLESKIIKGLYFAGEVLNVDGDVGGFNLSWAWSSGYVAGKLV
jgi:predicted Rossmann fold flavoprotein